MELKFSRILATFCLCLIAHWSYGQSTYSTDFEDGTKTGTYTTGNDALNGITWTLAEALIGNDGANDRFNGTKSLRLRRRTTGVTGTATMTSDVAGIDKISFKYARFGTDSDPPVFKVEYSTNSGSTWTQAGSDIDTDGVTTLTDWSHDINVAGNVRIRFRTVGGTNGRRANIDDLAFTAVASNAAPTDIALSNSSLNQTAATAGATVGNLTTTDADVGDTHAYSLESGTGDTHNGSFSIVGSQLRVGGGALGAGSYSVRIRTTDSGASATYEEAFTITVNDNVAPSAPSTPDMTTFTDSGNEDYTTGAQSDNLTNDLTPTFEGTAEVGATVTLTSNIDGVVGSGTATGGNYSITTSTLSAGAHTITATATDGVGNTSGASSGLSINIDVTQPTVVISTTSSDPTNDNPIPVTITFNSEAENMKRGDITIVNGTIGFAESNFASADSITFTANITPASNGNVQVSLGAARAFDRAGNGNTASNTLSLNFDGTGPTLTNQALAQTDSDDLQITYQSNESGTLYYVVTTNSSTPTQAQVKAGNDQSGSSTSVVSSGNAAVTVTGSNQTITLNGLTLASTTYHLFIYEEDGVGNESSVVTNSAAVDATAPTLTNQALAQTDSDDLQITYQSNETGTLYFVVTTNSSTPTQAQILAGNDQSGNSGNVVSSGNAAVTVTGSNQTISLNGLTLASTTYHLFIYEEDAIGNESSVVTNSAAVDATAPTLINQALAQTDNDDLQITYQSNETGTLYYVVTTNSSTPTQAQILAGNDQSGTSTNVVSSGNAAVTVTGSNQTIALNGLTLASTTYHLFIYEEDAAGNQSSVVTNSAAVDATAPTLINQALAQTASNAMQITYQSNESGTLYFVVTTNSSTPTQAQILAGNDQSGNSGNVVSSGNAAVTVTGSNQTIALNGLTLASTTYHLFIYEEDAIGNKSSVVTNSAAVDATAPTVSSTSPADDATGVEPTANISVTFNENMKFGTGFFQIRQTSDDVPIFSIDAADPTNTSNVASISGAVLTINPSGSFSTSTGYYLFVHSGTPFLDLAGNAFTGFTASTDFNFTILTPNSAPSFTIGANQTVSQGGGAQTIAGHTTGITDNDGSTQTLTFNVANDNNGIFDVQPDIDEATGNLTFTPKSSTFGKATVTVSLSDDGGTSSGGVDQSANQTFDIFITPDNIRINEVDASSTLEFVEIYDGGTGTTDLTGLFMVFYNGSTDTQLRDIDFTGSTDANGFYVIGETGVTNLDQDWGGAELQDGPDAVAIFVGSASDFTNGSAITMDGLVDAVVYDTDDADDAGLLTGLGQSTQFNENANGNASTESISRTPDGTGGFVIQAITPGETNDVTAPTVTGITSTATNGTFKVGDVITVTVTFSENVTVVGTPQLTLETGGTDRTVNYNGTGSGTTTLQFDYTVQTGDVSADLDYVTNASLTAGTSIQDAAGNDATLTLPTPGNAGSLAANKALVIDGVLPTLSSVTIASSQTASEAFVDASHGTTGNTITVAFTASEALNANPTVSMSVGGTGVTPTVNSLGFNNYTATHTLLGTENEGAVTFTIDFTDAAGNAGTQVTAVTNASSVEADFNAPTLSSVTLATNNSTDNQHGTTGDVVTLSFTSTDVLSANPTVNLSIGGTGVTATVNDLGSNNYSATYTLLGTENEGAVTFTIDFVDDAGISGTQVTATTNASSVEADFNAPTLSTVTIASSQTASEQFVDASHASDGNTVTLDIVSSDVLSALPTVAVKSGGVNVQGPVTVAHDNPGAPDFQNFNVTYVVDGVGSTPGTDKDADGAVTFTVDFVDDAGIAGTQVTATTNASTVTVDNAAPTLTSVTLASSQTATEDFVDASHGTTGNTITVAFTTSEALSANPTVSMSVGGTGVTATVNTGSAPNYTATHTLLGTENEGAVTFTIDFTDAAGNAGTQVTAVTNASSVEADFNAPTLSSVTLATNNGTDNQHGTTGDVVTLAFTSTDDLSANPTVGMSIGGTGVTATVNDLGSNNYSATYTLLGTENEGAVTFTIDFVDDAGISGTQVTATTDASSVEADFNAPTLTTVTLITDNGTNNQRAKDGNTVTLDLASSDVLSALPTVAIKSGGINVQGPITVAHDNPGAPDFQNFNVTFTVDGVGSTPGTDKDADGAVTFTVDFVDDAGISGTQVTATTNASTVTVDASAPTVTDVSSSTADGSFIAGNVIAVTVTFSESVTVTGTPQLTLETGTTDRTVNYTSGSPGTTLTFNYTVQAGDVSADLDYVANNSLALNSGAITDGAGNAATLTLPVPAAPNSLGANKALVIDTSNPTISSTSPADNATDVGITGDITITFNEDIAFGTGNITLVDITGAGTNTIVIDAASPGSQASISGAVLTINPTANLELNNNYAVQIAATAIDDLAGNSFAGITDNTTLNFTTINTSVAFSSTTSSAAESTSSANLAVSLNSASGATVTVNYAVVGTATGGGTDYTLAGGTLTFNPGDVTKNITIASIIDDALDEDDETVIVTLSNPTNAGLGTNTQHTYTINDNDATPTVSFNTTASNGAESVSSADLQVDLSAVSGRNVTVNYTITGTATGSGTDFTLANGALVINAGDANKNITIASIVEDALDEAEETVIVSLSSPVNATLGSNTQHIYTINDNDATPTVSFTSATSSGAESTSSANLQVDLSAVSGQDVMVDYTVTGTANGSGSDYTLADGTLTLTAGASLDNITIASIIANNLDEDDETVIVTLSNPINATLGTNTVHTYTIQDDDASPTTGFVTTSSNGDESTSSFTLSVALTGESGRDITLNYAVTGTATGGGTDYTLADGTFTLEKGVTSKDFTIPGIVDDLLDEFDETVIVTLSNPVNATLASSNAVHTYTINDNDAAPTVAFALATDAQTEDQPSQDVQVSLSAISGKTVTVNYAVTGTATAGGTDHTTTGGTITFNPGDQNFQQQIVGIVDDLLDEENETIILTLSSPSNATLGTQTTHTYTITDNDDEPTVSLSVDNSSIAENGGSSTVTATLSAISGKNVVVSLGFGGTATIGDDYGLFTTTALTITAGQLSASQASPVTATDDTSPEGNETVTVDITTVSNGTENGTQSQTITIVDDDTPDLTFTTASSDGAESVSSAALTVDLSIASGLTVTADYAVTGTATGGTDYTLANGTLTFNPGDVQKTITIAGIVDDAILEANETVIVTLTNLSNANAGTNQVHTYTINNNDAAAVTIADVSQAENEGDIRVTATLDNAVEGGFTVEVSTADGTAKTADSDYTAVTSQTLTFLGNAGETREFTITPGMDTKVEANETVTVSQGNLANTSVSIDISDGATVTINNDDNATVTIADVTAAENSGTQAIIATLSGEVQGGFAFDVFTTDGTGTVADSDYSSTAGSTLTFVGTNGETQQLGLGGLGDTRVEADETFTIGMQNVTFTTVNVTNIDITDIATYTITNDDVATLAIDDVTRAENADGATTTFTFTTTLTGSIDQAFTVDFITSDGTAAAGTDYTTSIGTLNFAGTTTGETQTLSVTVSNDDIIEGDETFTVTLSNVQAGGKAVTISDATGIGTITNDDNATVTIVDVSGNEDDGDITVTATLNNNVQDGFTVDVSTADGTATTADSDYTAVTSQTLTFTGTAGETQTFTISPTVDTKLEADETLTVSMSNVTPASAAASAIDISDGATVTLTNDDAAAVTIADVSGAENGGDLTFTATLDAAVQGGFTFDVNTADGTATIADSDYTAITSQTLTFAGTAGETQTFTVTPTADTKVEADETIDISMNNLQATSLSVAITDMAVGTISNDDAATLAIDNVTMNEGASGTTTYTFTATLTGTIDESFTVDYATADGTATTADGDYTAASGTLNFSGGTSGETQTFSVSVVGDAKVELDENFTVTLSNVQANGKNLTIATATGTGTITNDDNAAITIADISGAENGGDITVTVTLDNAVQGGFTVDVNTTDGTATAGSDYTAVASQTLTFAGTAGETQTFTISPTADEVVEADENLTVAMGSLANTTLSVDITDGATIGITNDDIATFTISDINANENGSGSEDAGPITMVVTLDKAVDIGFDVRVRSQGSTATEGTDYTALDETLTFAGTAGETKQFTVTPTADQILEADETLDVGIFSTTLDNNVRNRNIDDQALVTIVNDDAASFSIDDVTMAEGNSGLTLFNFTVTLTGAVDQQVTVDFTTADGTATTAGSDYSTNSNTLTFSGADGQTQTITVDVTGDMTEEPDENFTVTLSNVGDGGKGVTIADATGTGTITNEDDNTAPTGFTVTWDDTEINAAEAPTASFTFAGAEVGTTYNYTVSSAGGGTPVTGTGTIATATDNVTPVDVSTLSDGVLTLSVTLTDGFSNTSTAQTAQADLDTTAPTGTTVTSITTDTGALADDEITSDNTLSFAGAAEDGATVEVFIDGTSIGTTTATATGWSFDHTATTLADGTYALTARATDPFGNEGALSSALSVTVDTGIPGVVVSTTASTLVNSTFSVTVTYSEQVQNVALTDITIGNGAGGNFTPLVAGQSWTLDVTPTTDGTVTVQVPAATANDASGNDNTVSNLLTFTYDGTAPEVTSITRADPSPTIAQEVNFTVVFSEDVNNVDPTDFEVPQRDGITGASVILVTQNTASNYTVRVDRGTGEGFYGLNIKDDDSIVDDAGNALGGTGAGNGDFTGEEYQTNSSPSDISIDTDNIDENNALNDVITGFTSTDADAGDTFTYSLVAGTGDDDNGSFTIIAGAELIATEIFDFETKSSYSIRVQTMDNKGGTFEKQFTITINDVNEVAADIILSNSDVDESDDSGLLVGLMSTEGDPDASESFTYTLVSGDGDANNLLFAFNGDELRTAGATNFEETTSLNIRVRSTDSRGLFIEEEFEITVNNIEIEPIRDFNKDEADARVKNFFTPNGDGINDLWIVEDILDNPINEVKVYSQAGKLIFSQRNYTNDWDGTFDGEPIPPGTYYYEINIYNGESIIRGFLTIIRN